jgi:hypothetical protein
MEKTERKKKITENKNKKWKIENTNIKWQSKKSVIYIYI